MYGSLNAGNWIATRRYWSVLAEICQSQRGNWSIM